MSTTKPIASVLRKAYQNGPIAIVSATALMALQDTIVKLFNEGLPLWQLFLLRSAIVLPLLIAWSLLNGVRLNQTLDSWVLLRSVLVVVMYVCFYAALPVLDLSVVAGVYYTAPLWIFVLSIVFLGETITKRQMLILLVAFCGVIIVLKLGGEAFSLASLIPLLAAICYAFVAIITRSKIQRISPLILIISLNSVFLCVGALGVVILLFLQPEASYPFLLTAWSPLTWHTFWVTAMLSIISIAVHILLARAYQVGPTAVVASLDYSYLIFAVVWAALLLDTLPDFQVVLGTAFIAVAGVAMVVISAPQKKN